MLLVGDLALELVLLEFLLLEQGVAPGLELAEPLAERAGDSAVDPHGGAREVRQEAPVMADQDERGARRFQLRLEPFDRRQVEMVGRLVEQQDVGIGRQRADDRRAACLAAGQRFRIFLAGEPEPFKHRGHAIRIVERPEVALGKGAGGRVAGKVGLLREIAHRRAGLQEAHARIRLEHAGRDFEQRRLARAVATDEAESLTALDRQAGAFEQGAAASAQRKVDVLESEKGWRHARSLARHPGRAKRRFGIGVRSSIREERRFGFGYAAPE